MGSWGYSNVVCSLALATVDLARAGTRHALVFAWRSDFVATHYVEKLLTLSALDGVVWLSRVIQIEITFDPLTEFKVVLIFSFDQFIDLKKELKCESL